jgi:hypothetical protein
MNKLYSIIYHKIPYVSEVIDGIGNLIKWFPVIWKDRWWDYSFLAKIISHKLFLDAKEYEKQGIHLYADRDARKMKICAELMRRIGDYDYFEKKTKLWDLDLDYEKIPGHSICDPISNKDRMKLRRAEKNEEGLRKYYLNYFFKLMVKNIQTWWD